MNPPRRFRIFSANSCQSHKIHPKSVRICIKPRSGRMDLSNVSIDELNQLQYAEEMKYAELIRGCAAFSEERARAFVFG